MKPVVTVGFDRTENGYAAVRWAAAESDRRGALLRVITSEHLPVVADLPATLFQFENPEPRGFAERDQELTSLRSRLANLYPHLSVDLELVEGPPWYWLTKPLEQPIAVSSMVVVGPSSHVNETGLWAGGTTRHVVQHAACPVVVVHAHDLVADRVVVGVDGSSQSDAALNWAIQEANLHLAPLKVVHVWQYPYARTGDATSEARDLTQVDAACVLEAAVERSREACFGSVDAELLEGSAAFFLPTVVQRGDLLVLGRSGRGAVRRALFGSTVASVLDNVAVSVAVVPIAPADEAEA